MSAPNNLPLKISFLAQKDIEDVLLYTLNTWGEQQFTHYEQCLDKAFQLIIANPLIGTKTLKAKLRMLIVEQHRVFYRVEDTHIYIVRVLHKRMEVDLYL
jgi:toxin ParE1/3/4